MAETHAEEGVVMTASASLMLLLGLRLIDVPLRESHVEEAERLLATMKAKGAQAVAGRRHFVYLGGGPLYGLAAEGALKLMEMSLSFSQAFHPLEYRHGPISLVDDATLVALLYSEATRAEEERVAADVRKKGAVCHRFRRGRGSLSARSGNGPRAGLGPAARAPTSGRAGRRRQAHRHHGAVAI